MAATTITTPGTAPAVTEPPRPKDGGGAEGTAIASAPDPQPGSIAVSEANQNLKPADSPPPSIEALGRRLAALERAYNAADNDHHGTHIMHDYHRQEAMDLLLERVDAMRLLISTMRPLTLADAAVSAHAAGIIVGRLCDCNVASTPASEIEKNLEVAVRLIYSNVPIMAASAGLDIEVMDFTSFAILADRKFQGLSYLEGGAA